MIIARTSWKRMRGLIGYSPQPLLLVFPWRARWGVWMLGMRYGLHIVWFRDGIVVGVEHRPCPASIREMFRISHPPIDADMALEIPDMVDVVFPATL